MGVVARAVGDVNPVPGAANCLEEGRCALVVQPPTAIVEIYRCRPERVAAPGERLAILSPDGGANEQIVFARRAFPPRNGIIAVMSNRSRVRPSSGNLCWLHAELFREACGNMLQHGRLSRVHEEPVEPDRPVESGDSRCLP